MPGLSSVYKKPVDLKGYLSGSDYFCTLTRAVLTTLQSMLNII